MIPSINFIQYVVLLLKNITSIIELRLGYVAETNAKWHKKNETSKANAT